MPDKLPDTPPSRFQAIPTYYKGFRFRSRLEARWRVFFDELGIESHYEPEGWQFADGTCYLPDFFLPHIRAWVEIKPIEPTREERRKAEEVVKGTGRLLLFLVGPPDFRYYEGLTFDSGDFTSCVYSLDIEGTKFYHQQNRLYANPGDDRPTEESSSSEYMAAIYASRSERFDGKTPPEPGQEPFNPSPRDMGGW